MKVQGLNPCALTGEQWDYPHNLLAVLNDGSNRGDMLNVTSDVTGNNKKVNKASNARRSRRWAVVKVDEPW